MNTPLVSAIVVNWNGGAMLRDALASLFAQTWPALEVILVDNASSDGSAEQAERCFGDKLVVIRNAKNEGFAGGNNAGFRAAKGQWVFLLNSDAVCDPDVIAELMQFAADKPDVGQLACRVVREDQPNFFDSTGLLLYPDGVCRSRGWQEKNLGQYDRAEEVLAPHGCA
ncbi:MAG TPA: glycosyltransferase family 2 protein, partial [Vicinamibacterales bacterium]